MNQKLKCILLIDDDEPTNFLSSMIIEEAGCTKHIQIEDSGEKAINYLTKSETFPCFNKDYPCPDLIFIDINMPAMNGWEFLDKYKEIKKECNREIIMVMLTTSQHPDDELHAYNLPEISGFESKPLTREALDNILEKHFTGYFSGNN